MFLKKSKPLSKCEFSFLKNGMLHNLHWTSLISYELTNISDIPSYILFNLFESYYIYTMTLLNLFKTTLYTTCFDHHWSTSGVLKLFVETAMLAFCASNVQSVVPSHICVFRHAGCFLLLHCVLIPHIELYKHSSLDKQL
jgi:hypothetical protein